MRATSNRADYTGHKIEEQQPGDEQNGIWSRGRLERMNARFVERVEAAFENGKEHRPEPPPSRPRRLA